MRPFLSFVVGFLTLVVIFGAFLLWQGLLAQRYGADIARFIERGHGERAARSLPPRSPRGACAEIAPAVRPDPALRMLHSCRVETTSGGTARLLLTMTDGRTYQADVTSR